MTKTNRAIIWGLSILLVLSFAVFYRVDLFLTDKYEWHTTLGEIYYQNGRYLESEQQILSAININESQSQGRFLLGVIEYKKQNYDDAEKIFQDIAQAAQSKILESKSLYQLGRIHYDRQDFMAAYTSFERSYKINPNLDKNTIAIAFSLYRLNRTNESFFLLEQMIEHDVFSDREVEAEVHFGLSKLYHIRGDIEQAKKEEIIGTKIYSPSKSYIDIHFFQLGNFKYDY